MRREEMKGTGSRWVWVTLVFSLLLPGSAVVAQESDEDSSMEMTDDALQDFWAERRDVRIIQRRLFEKVGRHEFTLFGGVIPNDPFLDYFPIGLRYDYFLLESLALEVDGSYIGEIFRADSDLEEFLLGHGARVDLLDQQQWRTHFGINWSPFYGKIAFLGLKLLHFDINLNAGFGIVSVESLTEERLATETEIKPEGILGLGFNFWISDHFSVRLDYRQFLFEKAGGGVSNPSEISLGFSVFL